MNNHYDELAEGMPPSFTPRAALQRRLNNRRDIASDFCSSSSKREVASFGSLHGFLLSGGGFTALDVPGAAGTVAVGINDHGDIVGAYTDDNLRVHGFQRTIP